MGTAGLLGAPGRFVPVVPAIIASAITASAITASAIIASVIVLAQGAYQRFDVAIMVYETAELAGGAVTSGARSPLVAEFAGLVVLLVPRRWLIWHP